MDRSFSLVSLIALSLIACGDSNGLPIRGACTIGSGQSCSCADGSIGVQLCLTGTFENCDCQGTPVSYDLAIGSSDDLAVTKVGCAGFSTCMISCLNDDSSATLDGCETQCGKTARSDAAAKWEAAFACGQNYCLGNVDAGGYKCTLSADMTMFIDPPGDVAGTCDDCLTDSLAQLFAQTCQDMSSPDCNPSACAMVMTACSSDLP